MIEYMGLIYGFAKDLGKYLKWNEDSKLVDNDWLSKSGLKEKATESGYLLRWSLPKKIEARRLDGCEILHEVDKLRRVRSRLVLYDGSVLIGKRS